MLHRLVFETLKARNLQGGTLICVFAVYCLYIVDKEQLGYVMGPTHRFIETNGIRMHLAEQGEGPVVLLCHGFPELWYSWRHQLKELAAAGFHAVAPDMRGYGQTDRPEAIDQYTLLHLVVDQMITNLRNDLPKLQKTLILPECGH